MFDSGSSALKPYTRAILDAIVDIIGQVPNRVSLTGHTDQTPYSSVDGYSNWELSADRANAARRELLRAGLPEAKIGRVVGLGSSALYDTADPFNPINRRISLVVLNREADAAIQESARPASDVPLEQLKATIESLETDPA
jgi:chemotaxis protein MotB